MKKQFTRHLLLCAVLFLVVQGVSMAQNQRLFSLDFNNRPLKEVLDKITTTSSYKFIYTDKVDVEKINVSIKCTDQSLDSILKNLLSEAGLNYVIKRNQVIITPSERKVQQVKSGYFIQGTVSDSDGLPLPGAYIIIKGSKNNTISGNDGEYRLNNVNEGDIMLVTFIGMKAQEVAVGSKNRIDVILMPDIELLEDVVVTGYQTLSKERVTGSFATVTSDELNNTLTSDFASRLEGKVAGVKVDKGEIIIRGQGTLLSNTDPLIVVDGFPIEGGIATINPDDIQNVTVLKDAAAASIWGTRAGNGVIVITTKKGVNNKTKLDVSYTFSISNKNNYSDLHLINSEQSIDFDMDLIKNYYWTPSDVFWHGSVNKVQEAYYNADMELGGYADYNDVINTASFKSEIERLKKLDAYKQISKYLFRNPINNRANISLLGGNEKSDYFLSALFEHNRENEVRSANSDVKLNFKYNYHLLKNLTLSTNIAISYSEGHDNSIDQWYLANEYPYHTLVDESGSRIQYYMIDPWEGKIREEMGYLPYTTNLLDVSDANNYSATSFSTRVQAMLNYQLLDCLSLNTRFQYERGIKKTSDLFEVSHPTMRGIINAYTTVNSDGTLTNNFPVGAEYDNTNMDIEAWTWRNQIEFNKNINDDEHQISALAGHEVRLYRTKGISCTQYGFDPISLTYVPMEESVLNRGDLPTWMSYYPYSLENFNKYAESENRDLSLYANASYTYKKRYSATISGRMDQSNIYGNDSKYRYNIIWSAGLSWKISDESFMTASWVDNLQLRLTYGLGGNVNKNFYPVLMGSNYVDYWTGVHYIYLTNPANKRLRWETSRTLNVGLDYSLLKNRVSGSVDFYNKEGIDLLGRVALDPTNGFTEATMNFASVLNRGVEVTVNVIPVMTKDFSWSIGGNVTYNKNVVTKVDDGGSSANNYIYPSPRYGISIEGKPINRLYAYEYAGLNSNGEPMVMDGGEYVYWGDFSGDAASLKYMGTTVAPWYGGLNTSLRYKNFTLSAFATFEAGHVFRKPTSQMIYSMGATTDVIDRWRTQGDEQVTNVPGLIDYYTQYSMMPYYRFADINVLDASWIQLKEISFNYSFSKHLIGRQISDLNIGIQLRNICQWNKNDDNIDPKTIVADAYYGETSYGFRDPFSFIFTFKIGF